MFCLHFIFLPRINQVLKSFQEAWNSHGLSTECNWSPMQLFTAFSCNNPSLEEPVDQTYGIGSDRDSSDEDINEDVETVVIPAIFPPLPEGDLQALEVAVNPLQDSDCYGTELYLQTLFFVNNALEDN